ncbi:MAG: DUF2961 domain-containing protein [Promethearchaeota archaeon]|nr:MAG: DUF2961 domain-containing protein [Candidatus Lokiarchaeota archaeon]
MKIGPNSLANLARIRKNVKRKRISSYDRTGANVDFHLIEAKNQHEICNISGAGCIKHIWMTLASRDRDYLRKIVLRMWWDNEENPSVECPIGDFFGMGHGKTKNFWSLPLAMAPQDGKSFNCFFPMPFSDNARIEVDNETDAQLICYFYIDYEEYPELDDNYGRFHVFWNRVKECPGDNYETARRIQKHHKKNPTHENDYLILEAEGEGHYVGCHLDIHNLFDMKKHDKKKLVARINWPGEGDDYIEIDDGEIKIYGTGTEDYFCTAWCPTQYYCSPYFGIVLSGKRQWRYMSYYRYHIEDPIHFHKNIKVKIEHGHANQRSDDYSSTAYWYQLEPHKKFTPLLPIDERIPRKEPK